MKVNKLKVEQYLNGDLFYMVVKYLVLYRIQK